MVNMNKKMIVFLLVFSACIFQGCSSSPRSASKSELRAIEKEIFEAAEGLNCTDLVKFKRDIKEPVRSCHTHQEPEQSKCATREEALEKLFEDCHRNKTEKKRPEIEAENVINNNININNNNRGN